MWGLFVGLIIGFLQVLGLKIFGKMIFGDKNSAKPIGVLLLMVKIALIVFILYLISTVSLTHVIWTAGGMLVGLIVTLVILNKHNQKKTIDRGNTGGKDTING